MSYLSSQAYKDFENASYEISKEENIDLSSKLGLIEISLQAIFLLLLV